MKRLVTVMVGETKVKNGATRKEESQKATNTAKLGGGDDVELQNGMTVSIVTAYGSLKVHLIQSLAVLTVYGGVTK
ncbi:hypothetical protein P8452_32205 [Trifolium repens]|nr:hypothetical protein P8452_32205 [Trifolium repens]